MKLKLVHQNQESRGGGEEPVMKKEAVEMEEAEIRLSPADSVKDDFVAPVSASHPLLVSGKRKRKPKELIDEVSPIFVRRRKKSLSSKSKDVSAPPPPPPRFVKSCHRTLARLRVHVRVRVRTRRGWAFRLQCADMFSVDLF
ncbi:transmembrane protein [Perilla frutescens var. frutescens]|nr:transmembrane protein [Perilla frutescens var. frutescens]